MIKGTGAGSYTPPPLENNESTQECPKCMFTMEYLRDSSLLDLDYSVTAVNSIGYRDNSGWLLDLLISRFFAKRRERYFRKILKSYPNSLICPHCEYIMKRI